MTKIQLLTSRKSTAYKAKFTSSFGLTEGSPEILRLKHRMTASLKQTPEINHHTKFKAFIKLSRCRANHAGNKYELGIGMTTQISFTVDGTDNVHDMHSCAWDGGTGKSYAEWLLDGVRVHYPNAELSGDTIFFTVKDSKAGEAIKCLQEAGITEKISSTKLINYTICAAANRLEQVDGILKAVVDAHIASLGCEPEVLGPMVRFTAAREQLEAVEAIKKSFEGARINVA